MYNSYEHYQFDDFSVGEAVITYCGTLKFIGIIVEKNSDWLKIFWEGNSYAIHFTKQEFDKGIHFCKYKDRKKLKKQVRGC